MKTFFKLSIAYFVAAVAVVLLTRENGVTALYSAGAKAMGIVEGLATTVVMFICAGIVLRTITKTYENKAFILSVLLAFGGTVFFQAGFTLMKTSMPFIVPFYADAAFAEWDKVLHGGVDPFVFAHALADYLPMETLVPVYVHVWVWPAICLPIMLAAFDRDAERVKRTMIVYGIAWVFIGNVLALAGMSVGPIFYDRVYGGERFAELTAAIPQTPVINDVFTQVQDYLWSSYTVQDQAIGFGISAFPSVHVSTSFIAALYLCERSRLLGVVGMSFAAVILFLSIYSGYHYALDGYVSIAVIGGAWAYLRRRAAAPRQFTAPMAQLA